MKHKINKMAAIFIASIFALSGLGVAYAAWTDTITIDGTVTTGNVDLVICSWFNGDPSGPGDPPDYYSGIPDWHCNEYFIGAPWLDPEGKNVGWTVVTPIDPDGDGCYNNIEIELNNVYPCYYTMVSIYPRNTGTIPVKIQKAIVKWTDSTGAHETEITSVLICFFCSQHFKTKHTILP
jgi:predicted ribosomally synthesized peptide with SipW-like signal peptide